MGEQKSPRTPSENETRPSVKEPKKTQTSSSKENSLTAISDKNAESTDIDNKEEEQIPKPKSALKKTLSNTKEKLSKARQKFKKWGQEDCPFITGINKRQFLTMALLLTFGIVLAILASPVPILGIVISSFLSIGFVFVGTNIRKSHSKEQEELTQKDKIQQLEQKVEELIEAKNKKPNEEEEVEKPALAKNRSEDSAEEEVAKADLGKSDSETPEVRPEVKADLGKSDSETPEVRPEAKADLGKSDSETPEVRPEVSPAKLDSAPPSTASTKEEAKNSEKPLTKEELAKLSDIITIMKEHPSLLSSLEGVSINKAGEVNNENSLRADSTAQNQTTTIDTGANK